MSAIEKAAAMLRHEAESLKACHTLDGDWRGDPAEADYHEMIAVADAAISERDALRAELSKQQSLTDAAQHIAGVAQSRANRLQVKIEQMERQEPVAFGLYSGWALKATYLKDHEACEQRDRRQLTADLSGSLEAYRVVPLYTLPGAKGEEK